MSRADLPGRHELLAIAVTSAVAGFAMGALRPALHVAVEGAQVAAGIVAYADGNPFGLYQKSVWTLWHQLLAPFLAAGVHERTLCVVVSGLVGALPFVGLALLARAAGAPAWLACALPFVVVEANPAGWGFRYGIYLLGQGHTYGAAGLAWQLVTLGLFGVGAWRAGAFALGLGPAVHASLGAWVALASGVCALLSWRSLLPHARELATGGALGALVAGASLALHLAGAPRPEVDPAQASVHLDAFVRLWDAHRGAPNLLGWRTTTALLTVALAWLASVRDERPAATRFAFRVLAFAAVVGLAVGALQHAVAADALPELLQIAMPTRLLNLPMLAFPALAAGVLWRRRQRATAQAGLAVLFLGAFAAGLRPSLARFGLPLVGVLALAALWRPRVLEPASAPAPEPAGRAVAARRAVEAVVAAAAVAAVAVGFYEGVRDLRPRLAYLIDRSNDLALRAASERPGALAVASGIEVAQLRTRRSLVIDPGALDMLPYALAGGPALVDILDRVYAVDFFDPPRIALHQATLPEREVRVAFEARSAPEWAALARAFSLTDVLVPAGWRLQLPEVARSRWVALYHVPGSSGAPTAAPPPAGGAPPPGR